MEHITEKRTPAVVEQVSIPRTVHLVPLNYIDGFAVRPGFYEINGATAIPGGVNFTVHSHGATSIELLIFHREAAEPYAVLPFPENYRIGNVYSMIVFKLDLEEFEYALSTPSSLLEHVVGRLHRSLLDRWPLISGGYIRLAKLTPPIDACLGDVAVAIRW